MIKSENGKLDIDGDALTIMTEILHIILKIKKEVNVVEFHKDLNYNLLKCIQANNINEFLKINNINELAILKIIKEGNNVKL